MTRDRVSWGTLSKMGTPDILVSRHTVWDEVTMMSDRFSFFPFFKVLLDFFQLHAHLILQAVHFIVLRRYYDFYKLVCGNPVYSKSTGAVFPTAFAHFVCLHDVLVILTIFQTFPLFSYLLG